MKKVSLFLFLLVLIGSLPSLYTHNANPVLTQVARAQQIIPTATDCLERKWEYCSLLLLYYSTKSKDGKYTATADICYYQSTGCRRERLMSQDYSTGVYDDARAKAIAKLAEDGWEMFLFTPSSGASEYTFRRRKM
jgi:hypothetical protein